VESSIYIKVVKTGPADLIGWTVSRTQVLRMTTKTRLSLNQWMNQKIGDWTGKRGQNWSKPALGPVDEIGPDFNLF